MSVKRYDIGFDEGGCLHEIFEEPDGKYVLHADYAALESALRNLVNALSDNGAIANDPSLHARYDEARKVLK